MQKWTEGCLCQLDEAGGLFPVLQENVAGATLKALLLLQAIWRRDRKLIFLPVSSSLLSDPNAEKRTYISATCYFCKTNQNVCASVFINSAGRLVTWAENIINSYCSSGTFLVCLPCLHPSFCQLIQTVLWLGQPRDRLPRQLPDSPCLHVCWAFWDTICICSRRLIQRRREVRKQVHLKILTIKKLPYFILVLLFKRYFTQQIFQVFMSIFIPQTDRLYLIN